MAFPCVDGCLQSLTQDVYGFVKKRWLILYHFKKNFVDLKEKKEELEKQRGKVQEQVEKAKYKGEEIKKEVSEWMDDKDIKEFNDLMQRKTEGQSITCFNFSFPNCISRYQLSKRAEKEITALQKKMDEGKFTTVSDQGPNPEELQFPPTIGEYKVFESREQVLKDIKNALKENNVVGIHGTGGVGKTTMAAEVAKQLLNEDRIDRIDESVMLVVSRDHDVKRIQGELASHLQIQLDENQSEQERAKKLWNRLKNGKRNLVIPDDIWDKINLREIGIPVSVGNNECKLLITSRQPQEVWKDTTWDSELLVKQIRVKELNRQEAWALFQNHARDLIEPCRRIAIEICEKCGGLPVAIRAVGQALNGKDLYWWKDALDKLKNYEMETIFDIDVKLFPSLKLSYEMLSNKEAQSCFLLCCLFPEDFEIQVEELVLHCQAAEFVGTVNMEETRNRVNTLISFLKSRCLLLDVPYRSYCVKVHDVIRDVGIAISKKGNEPLRIMHGFRGGVGEDEGEPSSSEGKTKRKPYIAMWLRKSDFEDDHSFPGDVGTLFLDWYGSSIEDDHTLLQCVNNFLRGTIRSLKVLVLKGLNISSVFPPSSSGGESLPNLSMLWLDTWKADDAAVLRHLQKLKVFRLTDHCVVELPVEIRLLKELLVLDLKGLYRLRKIPSGVLSKLTRLEELRLPLNFREWENGGNESGRSENASISELSCLKRLTTLSAFFPNCDLPGVNDIFFSKLDRLDITVGGMLCDRTIVCTKHLTLHRVSITNKFNELICKADLLWFSRVNGLSVAIHGTSHGFPFLKKLRIEGCDNLNYVFTEPCARALPQLRILEVVSCESLVSIVGGIEEEISEQDQGGDIIYFRPLEKLELRYLPNLVGFHSWVKNRTSATADGATYIRGKIVYPALEVCAFQGMPKATEVFKSRILPQLTGQDSKEICQQENDFQGVSLPSLTFLSIWDRNIEMPEEISFIPAEHGGIKAVINEITKLEGVDKIMFQPLFDAVLGFGCE